MPLRDITHEHRPSTPTIMVTGLDDTEDSDQELVVKPKRRQHRHNGSVVFGGVTVSGPPSISGESRPGSQSESRDASRVGSRSAMRSSSRDAIRSGSRSRSRDRPNGIASGTGKGEMVSDKEGTISTPDKDSDTPRRRPQTPSSMKHRRSQSGPDPRHIAFALNNETIDPAPRAKRPSRIAEMWKKFLAHEDIAWVKPGLTKSNMKKVLRCSISIWVGFLLMLIHKSGMELGQAAFIVLICSCMVPPSNPFVQQLEIYINLMVYICLAWAWTAIGTAVADATRGPTDPAKIAAAAARWEDVKDPLMKSYKIIYDGTYLQAKPAIISSVFLCVGSGILLWWKMKTAPSPATFPIVLACIVMDIAFTMVPLFPTAFYLAPWVVLKPISIQTAIALVCSAVVFPQSASHQFRNRFALVFSPLHKALGQMQDLFESGQNMATFGVDDPTGGRRDSLVPPTDSFTGMEIEQKLDEWGDRCEEIKNTLQGSIAGIPLLQGQRRYLKVDVSYGRLSGDDLLDLFKDVASIQVRGSGMSLFFNAVVHNIRHTHLDSKGFQVSGTLEHNSSRPPSRGGSRPGSRANSRPGTPGGSYTNLGDARDAADTDGPVGDSDADDIDTHGSQSRDDGSEPRDSRDSRHRGMHHHVDLAHMVHLNLKRKSRTNSPRTNSPSRLAKSLGSQFSLHSNRASHVSLLDQLRKGPQPVGVYESQRYMDLERSEESDKESVLRQLELLAAGSAPLVKVLRKAVETSRKWSEMSDRGRRAEEETLEATYKELKETLEKFKADRSEVIKPYRHMFDPSHLMHGDMLNDSQHKGLFYCFVAQYHLIEFSEAVIKFLNHVIELDTVHAKRRLWVPTPWQLAQQFVQGIQTKHDKKEVAPEHDDGNAFDHSREDEQSDLLGEARRRDPDFAAWDSPALNALAKLSRIPDTLFGRSGMYMLKAGILTCLTTLPAFFSSTARFYYYNRGIWCTVMAQMTLAVFSGDTLMQWITRVVASFWGGVVGLAMWYIGSGRGNGNPYGMGAVTAVCFPVIMYYRLFSPQPVLTTVMFATTVCLVVGYSYLNGHIYQMTNTTWGWDVAWLRFVCVMIGITSAWIFSYVPPSYSAKVALRESYARSIAHAGRLLCEILSEANDPHNHIDDSWTDHARQDLARARTKLVKLSIRQMAARHEVSIRGRWPKEGYQGLLSTLQDVMSLLAMFNHVLPQMDRKWRQALLARTRMNDPLFLGDVLAVINMCFSSLRSGTSLPQITPGPLIAKYHMGKYHGLEVPVDPAEHHDDMPSVVTGDVLESDDYMRYAVGVSTVYALMSRLDGMVVVVKTLVGEGFHISNLKMGDFGANAV